MHIALTLDQPRDHRRITASQKRNSGIPYWILLGGILSGLGSLVLAAIAAAHS